MNVFSDPEGIKSRCKINPDLSSAYKTEIIEKSIGEIKCLISCSKEVSDSANFICDEYEMRREFFKNNQDIFLEELYDFFNSAHPIIRKFINSFLRYSNLNYEANPECGINSQNILQDEIDVFFEKEYVLLSLPLLSNRQAKHKRKKDNSKEISEFYYYSLVEKLEDKLEEIFGENKYDYCDSFYDKNICYLFNTGFGQYSADVDNLETGSVTDAIGTIFWGDSAFTTSFSLMPIDEKKLPNKTFVVITRGKNSILSEEKYLEILKNHF